MQGTLIYKYIYIHTRAPYSMIHHKRNLDVVFGAWTPALIRLLLPFSFPRYSEVLGCWCVNPKGQLAFLTMKYRLKISKLQ